MSGFTLQAESGASLLTESGAPIMAEGGVPIGSQADFVGRMKAVLPARWFPDTTPVLDALLNGIGSTWASLYSLLIFVRQQTRIATASGVFLDMISLDFFNLDLPRLLNENDTAFRARIRKELFRERGTRAAVISVITDLTGAAPWVFEPAYAFDTGGYGSAGMTAGTGLGYGVAGGYGSLTLPFQFFVRATLPPSGGMGYYAGSGWAGGGYGVGSFEYLSLDGLSGKLTEDDIYRAIDRTRPVGTIAWVQTNALPGNPHVTLWGAFNWNDGSVWS